MARAQQQDYRSWYISSSKKVWNALQDRKKNLPNSLLKMAMETGFKFWRPSDLQTWNCAESLPAKKDTLNRLVN